MEPTLADGGRPIDHDVRKSMNAWFRHDFGRVRIHADQAAARSALAIGARAYTVGSDIVFGPGQYDPRSPIGQSLLAHELTHAVQQSGAARGQFIGIGTRDDLSEFEAERSAAAMMAGVAAPRPVLREAQMQLHMAPLPAVPTAPVTGTANGLQARLDREIEGLETEAEDEGITADLRASLERQVVILRATAPAVLASESQIDDLVERAAVIAASEDATSDHLRGALGEAALNDYRLAYPVAFPKDWSQRVYAVLDAHVDVAELNRQLGDRLSALRTQANGLPGAIVLNGLPIGRDRARNLRAFHLGLGLTTAQQGPTHPVVAFARATAGFSGLAMGVGFLVGWQRVAETLRDDIAAGRHVVDVFNYLGFRDNQQRILAQLPQRIRTVGLGEELNELEKTMVDLANVQLVRSWAATLTGLASAASVWKTSSMLFDDALGRAGDELASQSKLARIGTAITWAYRCGYLADEAVREFKEILDQAPSLIAGTLAGVVLGFILAQAIPGVDLVLDAIVVIVSGAEALEAGYGIYRALAEAAAARSVVEMQRASAGLATALIGDGLRLFKNLALVAISGGALRGRMANLEAAGATREDAFRRAFDEEVRAPTPRPSGADAVRGKRLGQGPKAAPGPAYVRKAPTQAELDLVAAMQRERIERGLAEVDIPALRSYLEKAPMALREINADAPQMMGKLWTDHQARLHDPAFKTTDFGQYVRMRMRAFRGRLGEFLEGFLRGPDELMAYAPKDVTTEAGLDMVTYTADRRIKVIDNKAYRARARVREVSAFEAHLPENLRAVIAEMEQYAGAPGVPRELKRDVIPSLKAAHQEVAAEYAKELAANPKANLYATSFQKRISAILDRHGIDRVVTLSGSGEQVKVTAALLDRLTP